MKKEVLQKRFKVEIDRSFLLSEEDKDYWLKQAPNLPVEILGKVFKAVKTKNAVMEKYIKVAMISDPSLVEQLRNTIKKVKRNTLKAAEKEEQNPEDVLNKKLSDL